MNRDKLPSQKLPSAWNAVLCQVTWLFKFVNNALSQNFSASRFLRYGIFLKE